MQFLIRKNQRKHSKGHGKNKGFLTALQHGDILMTTEL